MKTMQPNPNPRAARIMAVSLLLLLPLVTVYATRCTVPTTLDCVSVRQGQEATCTVKCPVAVLCRITCSFTVQSTPKRPWVSWEEQDGNKSYSQGSVICSANCGHGNHYCELHRRYSYETCTSSGGTESTATPTQPGCDSGS